MLVSLVDGENRLNVDVNGRWVDILSVGIIGRWGEQTKCWSMRGHIECWYQWSMGRTD